MKMSLTNITAVALVSGAAFFTGCTTMNTPKGTITKAEFGTTTSGQAVEIYTLRNTHGAEARILTYGGIVLGILTTPPEEMVKAVAKMTGINPVKLIKQVMTAPAEQRTQLLGMVKGMVTQHTGLPDADIYPGKYSPLPNGFADWIAQVFAPGDSKQLDLLYETGVKDGTAWAVEQGLIPPFIKDAVRTPFVDLIAAKALSKM